MLLKKKKKLSPETTKNDVTPEPCAFCASSILTVRFMKLRNFFSISVMMEKSPLGRCSRTQVTFTCGGWTVSVRVAGAGGEWREMELLHERGATFSPGCLGRGIPAAEPCRRPRCCPPCVYPRAAELQYTRRESQVCQLFDLPI